ncbi:MAG: polyprenol monophosphomannose synthase [Acidimicrobiia bacterium]|nr:polyprenol monophosphomannose synthase [Acidimicrobiia bacterium]
MPADPLVIIPTYNEVENLEAIVRAVSRHGYQVLIVDDASPDGTGDLADSLAAENPTSVAVLHRTEKSGLGPAYVAGFAWGLANGASILCEMDADFSHDPNSLSALVGAIENGADVAIGSRYVAGGGVANWPWHRRALSRFGNIYAGFMLGTPVKDMTAGFRAFSSRALGVLEAESCDAAGYGFQVEMAWRAHLAGLDIVERPITFRDRERGESKMDTRIAVEAMLLVTKWGLGRLVGRLPWTPNAYRSPTSV